jgi:hypothetical protein
VVSKIARMRGRASCAAKSGRQCPARRVAPQCAQQCKSLHSNMKMRPQFSQTTERVRLKCNESTTDVAASIAGADVELNMAVGGERRGGLCGVVCCLHTSWPLCDADYDCDGDWKRRYSRRTLI